MTGKKCICYRIINSRDMFKSADSSSNETIEAFMSVSLNYSSKPIFFIFILKIVLLNIFEMCIIYLHF